MADERCKAHILTRKRVHSFYLFYNTLFIAYL